MLVGELTADPGLFLRGMLIGVAIAAPVGPIGVLCIRRTLAQGKAMGIATGFGAASADAIYAAIAGYGLTLITTFLISQQVMIHLVGGVFLCYLGIRTTLSKPGEHEAVIDRQGLARAYASTFFLTITNPLTILSFTAILAGLGLGAASLGFRSATLTILGVFLGSASWWLLLSMIVSHFRHRFGVKEMYWVNRISGLVILGFGVFAIIGLFG